MTDREHLVVVLPGVGGSVLADPRRLDRPVWDTDASGVMDFLVAPGELDIGRELVPVGLIKSLRLFGAWTPILGYERLLTALRGLKDVELHDGDPAQPLGRANVVALPYDFRRSVVDAAVVLGGLIRERLALLWPAEHTKDGPISGEPKPRVVFVAHSMGGLVARYWLAQDENWRLCRTLITLGTPHRGAPKALDVLANGVPVGKRVTFHLPWPRKVLRGWPGLYELLPRYPMIEDLTGSPTDPAAAESTGRWLRPHELLHPNLEWLRNGANNAWGVHRNIEIGWNAMPRTGPDVKARIGYGHGTLQWATWDGRRLRASSGVLPQAIGAWSEDQGDGTVPAISGLPIEMDNDSGTGLRVPLTHSGIVNLDQIVGLIEDMEGRPPLTPIHGDKGDQEHPLVLGLDAPDVAEAGKQLEVSARIQGTPEDTGSVVVFASITPIDAWARPVPGATREIPLDRADDEWSGMLPPMPPGAYRLRVSADAVPGGGSPSTERIVQLIDPDALA